MNVKMNILRVSNALAYTIQCIDLHHTVYRVSNAFVCSMNRVSNALAYTKIVIRPSVHPCTPFWEQDDVIFPSRLP